MSFVSLNAANSFSGGWVYKYINGRYDYEEVPYKLQIKLKEEDTGIFIFNKQSQLRLYEAFIDLAPKSGFKIIYESPWCINKRYSTVTGRNKLVLFERQ